MNEVPSPAGQVASLRARPLHLSIRLAQPPGAKRLHGLNHRAGDVARCLLHRGVAAERLVAVVARLVAADVAVELGGGAGIGNPDPTTTHGKHVAEAKRIEQR